MFGIGDYGSVTEQALNIPIAGEMYSPRADYQNKLYAGFLEVLEEKES